MENNKRKLLDALLNSYNPSGTVYFPTIFQNIFEDIVF
jgi:hypothetical protein